MITIAAAPTRACRSVEGHTCCAANHSADGRRRRHVIRVGKRETIGKVHLTTDRSAPTRA